MAKKETNKQTKNRKAEITNEPKKRKKETNKQKNPEMQK